MLSLQENKTKQKHLRESLLEWLELFIDKCNYAAALLFPVSTTMATLRYYTCESFIDPWTLFKIVQIRRKHCQPTWHLVTWLQTKNKPTNISFIFGVKRDLGSDCTVQVLCRRLIVPISHSGVKSACTVYPEFGGGIMLNSEGLRPRCSISNPPPSINLG